MITEDYCSFEVAKLLKEKGFDYQGFDYIDFEGEVIRQDRPTHQMAMKWLREVHNLCIAPYAAAYRYGFTIDKADTGSTLGNERKFYPSEKFETYEEAVEAALKYTLEKLI